MSGFNLVDEPWVRVRDAAGRVREVSLREAFAGACDYRDLAGELPITDFSVLRIMLAVLYRALDAEAAANPPAAWEDLWRAGSLPMDRIDAYLATWHDRFDLFHPEHPFFQVADLQAMNGDTKPVSLLMPDGDDDGLFVMRRTDRLTAGEAARWLVTCQAYDPSGIKGGAAGDPRVKGGRGYPIGIGWAGWMGGITVTGENLRETLLLNLVLNRRHDQGDLPIWEEPPLTSAPRESVVVRGQVQLLTWPQRRIRLFHEGGTVTSVLVCNGDPVPYTTLLHDELMTGWRHSAPQSKKAGTDVYMPRGFDPRRAVWRGLQALLPVAEAVKIGPPANKIAGVLDWSAHLANRDILDPGRITTIRTVGVAYGPQQASWDEVFADELSFDVRLAIAEDTEAKEDAFMAVQRAEVGVRILASLAGNLAIAAGGPAEPARDAAYVQGFADLDQPFRQWLRDFRVGEDEEESLQQWTDRVRGIIVRLGQDLVAGAGSTAWVGRVHTDLRGKETLMTVGLADVWFRAQLAKELPHAVKPGAPEVAAHD